MMIMILDDDDIDHDYDDFYFDSPAVIICKACIIIIMIYNSVFLFLL